MKPWRNQKSL